MQKTKVSNIVYEVFCMDMKTKFMASAILIAFFTPSVVAPPVTCEDVCTGQGYESGYCDDYPIIFPSAVVCEQGGVNIGPQGECSINLPGAGKSCCCTGDGPEELPEYPATALIASVLALGAALAAIRIRTRK